MRKIVHHVCPLRMNCRDFPGALVVFVTGEHPPVMLPTTRIEQLSLLQTCALPAPRPMIVGSSQMHYYSDVQSPLSETSVGALYSPYPGFQTLPRQSSFWYCLCIHFAEKRVLNHWDDFRKEQSTCGLRTTSWRLPEYLPYRSYPADWTHHTLHNHRFDPFMVCAELWPEQGTSPYWSSLRPHARALPPYFRATRCK